MVKVVNLFNPKNLLLKKFKKLMLYHLIGRKDMALSSNLTHRIKLGLLWTIPNGSIG
jgi:hypothetical protein